MTYSDLVTATLEDDQPRINAILDELFPVLTHYLVGTMNSPREDAEDCSQEALISLLEKIKPAMEKTDSFGKDLDVAGYAEKVAYANVIHSMDEILERSSIIRSLYREGKIGIVGGMYSVENGKVHFIRQMFAEAAVESSTQQRLAV